VGMKADRAAQAATDKSDQADIAKVATRAGATLQLVKAAEVISIVGVPAVERHQTGAERVVRTGKANLRACLHGAERRLAIEAIDERRVRNVARADGEEVRYRNRLGREGTRNHSSGEHDARQDAAAR